jgi:hypothetical protein
MPYQPTWVNPYLQQNPYQQPVIQPQMPYQQPVNGITKVNGRDSALQYQLPPNSMSPALFDNDGKTFYIVSTDGTGMKTVEAFDFTPHVEQKPVQIDGAQFVSRQEYDQFVAKVSAALGALNGIYAAVQPTAPANGAEGQNVNAQTDDAGGHVGAGK